VLGNHQRKIYKYLRTFKIFEVSKSVYISVTLWTKFKRRLLNLYVIHHRKNLIVLKNLLQDTKMNTDIRVGEA